MSFSEPPPGLRLGPLFALFGLLLAGCDPGTEGDRPVGSSLRLLTPPPAHRIVVASLRNYQQPLVEDPDGLLLAQLLQLFLGCYPDVDVYPPDQTALLELQGLLSTDPSADQAEVVRHLTAAETVVTGVVRSRDGSLEVVLDLSATGPGQVTVSASGPAGDPLRLAEGLADEVHRRLDDSSGTGNLSDDGGSTPPARRPTPQRLGLPRQASALRSLAAGRRRLFLSDAAGAAELLGRAAAAVPHRALPRLELARALYALGSFGRAREEARLATELATAGTTDGLLEARAFAALLDGHPRRAAELHRQRIAARPWSAGPRFALVRALLEAGDARAAFTAIAELRSLLLGANDRLRIELLAARAALRLGDASGSLLLAETARDRAAETGLALFEAQAWLSVAEAHLALGHARQTQQAAESARRLFLRFSHRRHAAIALAMAATGSLGTGERDEARTHLLEAAEELRRESDAGSRATVLHNLGTLELGQGNPAVAQAHLRESLDLRRSLGDSIGSARCLLRLADIELGRGLPARAQELYLEALALLQSDGLSPQEGAVALELAARLGVQRELPTLNSTRAQVRDVAIEAGDRELEARARSDLAESLVAGGELEAAGIELAQALALFAELDDADGTRRCRLLLASVASEQGRFGEAAALAEQVVEGAVASGDRRLEAIARTIVAWSHLELGREHAASDHMSQAVRAARAAGDTATLLPVEIAAARLVATTGRDREARRELELILTEARQQGLARTALEAELALAEITLHQGDGEAGRLRLQQIAEAAAGDGWRLLADKARRAATADTDRLHPDQAAPGGLLESFPTSGVRPPP